MFHLPSEADLETAPHKGSAVGPYLAMTNVLGDSEKQKLAVPQGVREGA